MGCSFYGHQIFAHANSCKLMAIEQPESRHRLPIEKVAALPKTKEFAEENHPSRNVL